MDDPSMLYNAAETHYRMCFLCFVVTTPVSGQQWFIGAQNMLL